MTPNTEYQRKRANCILRGLTPAEREANLAALETELAQAEAQAALEPTRQSFGSFGSADGGAGGAAPSPIVTPDFNSILRNDGQRRNR